MIKKGTLSGGHKDSVLSLDINTFGVIASGGEDKCLCVWNDETPSTKLNSPNDYEIAGICFSKQKPEQLFFSAGTKIFNYDLRSMSSPLCEYEYNEDEINQIVLHGKEQYLAACDDTGSVKIIDLHQKKLFKTLKRSHSNICSSLQFRPNRPWDLVTGGMDFKVVYWDFSTGRVTHEVNVQETGDDDDNKYFINPPFVHSIHVKDNSKDFAVGLGELEFKFVCFFGRWTLGFVGLKVFYARLQENKNKIVVMRDLNSLQYVVLTDLACGIAGKICKKYCIAG